MSLPSPVVMMPFLVFWIPIPAPSLPMSMPLKLIPPLPPIPVPKIVSSPFPVSSLPLLVIPVPVPPLPLPPVPVPMIVSFPSPTFRLPLLLMPVPVPTLPLLRPLSALLPPVPVPVIVSSALPCIQIATVADASSSTTVAAPEITEAAAATNTGVSDSVFSVLCIQFATVVDASSIPAVTAAITVLPDDTSTDADDTVISVPGIETDSVLSVQLPVLKDLIQSIFRRITIFIFRKFQLKKYPNCRGTACTNFW
ncbi:hypothetical protein [Nostoc sp.]|uniref:hypothetical protein n=1 Tax=Nostoc sp. TaxID=1180 RepID=UPI002FFBB829